MQAGGDLKPARDAGSSAKSAALQDFRRFPEKAIRAGTAERRYRVLGTATRALLAIPGGELVNDLGFEFALAISDTHRVVYPAYPRVSSIEELADGLCTILDAEEIEQAAILGASFGGAVAQVCVRRHPGRISALILSNTGVPLRYLARSVRISGLIARALPWPVTIGLLRKPLIKMIDPAPINSSGQGISMSCSLRDSQRLTSSRISESSMSTTAGFTSRLRI